MEITLGEIVALLEEGITLVECVENAAICERADTCPTRLVWKEVSEAVLDKLQALTLEDLVQRAKVLEGKDFPI
jgi:DNA-binding IscR family transcriptional regulator